MELPQFEIGPDGFPVPSTVVKYYREHMTYTDTDGKEKRWTQADLARHLGVSEKMVGLMETKNQGLADIDRRRTLASLLNIPLALLGLASLDDLNKIFKPQIEQSKQVIVERADVYLCQEALSLFVEKSDKGINPKILETWIDRIKTNPNNMQPELIKYHLLLAKAYYSDFRNFGAAKPHLFEAKESAQTLRDPELISLVSHYEGEMYLSQNKPLLAYNELMRTKDTKSSIQGYILVDVALSSILAKISDNQSSLAMLDKAEHCIGRSNDLITFDTVQYLECKAESLIALNKYRHALECLDDSEEYIMSRFRNKQYNDILRAECYIKQKRPEYEEALRLLSQVADNSRNISGYVKYVAKLHKIISQSSYGKAPDVVELGMKLRKLGAL